MKETLFLFVLLLLIISLPKIVFVDKGVCNPDLIGIIYNSEIIKDGGLPLIDTVDVKYPGSFFLLGILPQIGDTYTSLMFYSVLWLFFSSIVMFYLIKRMFGKESAIAGAIVFAAMFSFVFAKGYCPNYTTWIVLPFVLSAYSIYRGLESGDYKMFLLSGLFAGFAFLIKRPAITEMLFIIAIIFLLVKTEKIKKIGLSIAGFAASLILLSIPYLIQGKFIEFFSIMTKNEWAIKYISENYSGITIEYFAAMFFNAIFSIPLAVVFLVVLTFVLFLIKINSQTLEKINNFIFGYIWLISCFFVFLVGQFQNHYLIQLIPAMSLIIGSLFNMIKRDVSEQFYKTAFVLFIIFIIILSSFQTSENNRIANFYFDNLQRDLIDAGNYIKDMTSENDKIFVFGYRGMEIYYYSERDSFSKIYKEHGTLTKPNNSAHIQEIDFDGPWTIFYEDFAKERPKYFVFTENVINSVELESNPKLEKLIEKYYIKDRQFDWDYKGISIQLYKLTNDLNDKN